MQTEVGLFKGFSLMRIFRGNGAPIREALKEK
jgi:hypothetical protein